MLQLCSLQRARRSRVGKKMRLDQSFPKLPPFLHPPTLHHAFIPRSNGYRGHLDRVDGGRARVVGQKKIEVPEPKRPFGSRFRSTVPRHGSDCHPELAVADPD